MMRYLKVCKVNEGTSKKIYLVSENMFETAEFSSNKRLVKIDVTKVCKNSLKYIKYQNVKQAIN